LPRSREVRQGDRRVRGVGNAVSGGAHQGAHVRALAVTGNDTGWMHIRKK